MAIDPATAKVIAQVTAKALADEEARNNLLYVILISIAGAVIILLLPIYILTQPMEALKSAFKDTSCDAVLIEQFKAENDEKVLVIGSDLVYEGVYPLPVKETIVTGKYGVRIDPITGERDFHYGTDFSGVWPSKIYAVADGKVVAVCTDKKDHYGRYIIIRHTGEQTSRSENVGSEIFYALYGHMNEIYMYEGQSVNQGAVIGLMGGDLEKDNNPGRSAGTLLHFEIRQSRDGMGINPAGYIFPAWETEE